MRGSHIVVDIETLGVVPESVILSIGAVHMIDGKIDEDLIFYVDIFADQTEYSRSTCPETRAWWKKEENASALAFWRQSKDKKILPTAMHMLAVWVREQCRSDTLFWSKGSVFDFPILWSAARISAISEYFIPYYDVMCIRPLMKSYEFATKDERCTNLETKIITDRFNDDFIKHTAVCDAMLEAHILREVTDYLGLYQS